jgi:3-oxoacyl-[acyl-carrier protein] reductase
MMRNRERKTVRPVAIVTGAGRRLGRQIALALAKAGFDLTINYFESRDAARKTVERIQRIGSDAIAIRADVASRRQVLNMVAKTVMRFGRIDVLVNNSSIYIDSPLLKTTELDWDRTIDVNLKGQFLCAQAVAPVMLRQGYGRIVNIASLGGLQAWSEHLPYSVSKAGVIMLTRCLAKSLAPKVLVNAVAPGTINIPGEESLSIKHLPPTKIPLKKFGTPSDVTDLVIFLATTASYITGQVISVDGGRSIP